MASSRVVVVGAGVFGRNHLRIWRSLDIQGARRSWGSSSRLRLAAAVAAEFQVPVFTLQRTADPRNAPECRIDRSPNFTACGSDFELLTAGVDVLVEKPFTATLQQADELI